MMTPQPWKYGVRSDGSKWLSLGDPAKGQHRQGDLCATKEDADLICAAPDLLKALKAIQKIGVLNPTNSTHVRKAIADMVAAISKAEGRS